MEVNTTPMPASFIASWLIVVLIVSAWFGAVAFVVLLWSAAFAHASTPKNASGRYDIEDRP